MTTIKTLSEWLDEEGSVYRNQFISDGHISTLLDIINKYNLTIKNDSGVYLIIINFTTKDHVELQIEAMITQQHMAERFDYQLAALHKAITRKVIEHEYEKFITNEVPTATNIY